MSTHAALVEPTVSHLTLAEGIEKDPALKSYENADPGYPKTVIFVDGLQSKMKVKCKAKRFNATKFQDCGDFDIQEKGAILLVVSGRGYLPGEKVAYRFMKGPTLLAETFLIPNPAVSMSAKKSFQINAELVPSLGYTITLIGPEKGEEFTMESESGTEKMSVPMKYPGPGAIMYMPDVIGMHGGIAKLTYIRKENKDKATINLRWGDELKKYYKRVQQEASQERH